VPVPSITITTNHAYRTVHVEHDVEAELTPGVARCIGFSAPSEPTREMGPAYKMAPRPG
jgi:hypothetical protein